MAWQLIYTSAPRLLEAGRTGFGTVARHRAVSGMLASTVERFSQFARLPGHDPRRVVHTYRLLTVAGSSYHVFSCLKDAGSDYTGRTNHLAQHVIAEAPEIRALAASGLNPADVLLVIPWRSSWTEAPRFLDPGEEIDLAGFRPVASSAWASVTGNPAYARLLCTPQALKGCYLIPPSEVNVLELFREAMLEAPQAGWQTSFTTNLEPNDEVGDFRWIGLPPGSPLRAQAEVSNRPLLDLNQPAKLPAPPAKPAPPPPKSEEPSPVEVEKSEQIRSPSKVSLGRPPTQPTSTTTMGGWSPEPLKQASKKKGKGLLLAFVAVSVLIASSAGFFLWQHVDAEEKRKSFQDQVDKVWKTHGITLVETKKRFRDERDLETGQALLGSLQAYLEGVQEVLKNSGSKAEPPQPENTSNMPDFDDLQDAFKKWTAIENDTKKLTGGTISDLSRKYSVWQRERERCWKTLADHIKIGPPPDVDPAVIGKIVESAKELLRTTQPDMADISVWEQLNERLGNDETIAEWLEIWSGVDGSDKVKVAETARKKNDSLPPWLIKKTDKVLADAAEKALAKKQADENGMQSKEAKNAANFISNIQDADSLDAKHSIYICLLSGGITSIGIHDLLSVEPEMQIYVGGPWDKHPRPDEISKPQAGELRKWQPFEAKYYANRFNPSGANLGFRETRLESEQSSVAVQSVVELSENLRDGCRIVARSKDGIRILFEMRIVPAANATAQPIFWQTVPATTVNDGKVTIQGIGGLLSRLKGWVASPPSYRLRHEGSASEQVIYRLQAADGAAYSVLPPAQASAPLLNVEQLKTEISDLKKGIQRDDEDLKKNEDSISPEKIKKENRDKYTKARNDKELKLEEKRAQLAEIENQMPPPFALKPGTYMLLEGNTEVCKLDVLPQVKASKSPPKKP